VYKECEAVIWPLQPQQQAT